VTRAFAPAARPASSAGVRDLLERKFAQNGLVLHDPLIDTGREVVMSDITAGIDARMPRRPLSSGAGDGTFTLSVYISAFHE